MGKLVDISGQRFQRLLVLNRSQKKNSKHIAEWNCLCDCGNTVIARSDRLRSGATKSCGCLQREHASKLAKTKHGKSDSKIYQIWNAMKNRCYNPNVHEYPCYGGRGISVCEQWRQSFASFYEDMREPSEGCSLDRINNDGNYEPSNCRWATRQEQARNKSTNRLLTHNGVTKTIAGWAEAIGIAPSTLLVRVKSGWTTERALFAPVSPSGKAAKDLFNQVQQCSDN